MPRGKIAKETPHAVGISEVVLAETVGDSAPGASIQLQVLRFSSSCFKGIIWEFP